MDLLMYRTAHVAHKAPVSEKAVRAVQAGAEYLDTVMPGWEAKIDLDSLALASSTRCVLGQLYPESQPIPRWQYHGFASIEEALAACTNWDEEVAQGDVCIANYDLGVSLAANDKEIPVGEKEAWAIDHGFQIGSRDDYDYGDLEWLWADILYARKGELV
jgi:hypothetical protein